MMLIMQTNSKFLDRDSFEIVGFAILAIKRGIVVSKLLSPLWGFSSGCVLDRGLHPPAIERRPVGTSLRLSKGKNPLAA